jgi:tRNA threonylcarbamoyladenosine biosynthesis protein TsaB
MLILIIRTDKPEAELGLFEDTTKLAYEVWEAHRQLGTTLHQKIEQLLSTQNKTWQDVQGIACFQGPGSFTGLRIGLSVANALAYGLNIPVVAAQGEAWIQDGISRLKAGERDPLAMPFYGSDAHITLPRH